jgi:hypothetical protein
VQLVGLFLVVLTLVIVVMPEFDLPPTIMRAFIGTQNISLAAFTFILHSRVAPLLPGNTNDLPKRIAFSGFRTLLASLIDLDCSRLC